MSSKVKVLIIESERGWGTKVEETLFFDNLQEAEKYCKDYNKELTDTVVPDWYMKAVIA